MNLLLLMTDISWMRDQYSSFLEDILFSIKALFSLEAHKTSGFCSRNSLSSILCVLALAVLQPRLQGSVIPTDSTDYLAS